MVGNGSPRRPAQAGSQETGGAGEDTWACFSPRSVESFCAGAVTPFRVGKRGFGVAWTPVGLLEIILETWQPSFLKLEEL